MFTTTRVSLEQLVVTRKDACDYGCDCAFICPFGIDYGIDYPITFSIGVVETGTDVLILGSSREKTSLCNVGFEQQPSESIQQSNRL